MDDKKYKELLYDSTIKPKQIMDSCDIPDTVYKYRKFIAPDNADTPTYWRESLNGEIFFSLPSAFNSNDSNDCILAFDEGKCKKTLADLTKVPTDKLFRIPKIKQLWNTIMKQLEVKVRENIKIGCFSNKPPSDMYMWQCKEFGGENKGYCIEYEISEKDYTGTTIFLPVSYDTDYIDMTDVVIDLINHVYIQDDLSKHLILMANGYNFALSKLEQYKQESEWRFIITTNNWNKYFDLDHCSKKNFASKMKAVYLGSDCKSLRDYEIYKKYAIHVCKEKGIPLYEMYMAEGRLNKKMIN